MAPASGAIGAWLGFLAYERGLAPRTRKAYETDVSALARDLRIDPGAPAAAWGRVRTEQLRRRFARDRRAGLAESTRARRLVAAKSFFAWLRSEGEIPADPAAVLVQARRTIVLPHAITREDAERFLSLSWEQRRDMGLAGRAKVEREFDRKIVVEKYLKELP